MTTTSFLAPVNSTDVYRGMTSKFRITVTQAGAAYDLTGATLYFTVKSDIASTSNKLQKKTGDGITTVGDARNGQADLLLSASDTQTLDCGSYEYDVVVEKAGERFLVIGPATLAVKQSVTRF